MSKHSQKRKQQQKDHSREVVQQHGDGETTTARPILRPKLPVWKKLLFAAVATISVLVLLEVALMVFGVRPGLYGDDPYVGFSSQIPLFVSNETDDGKQVMVTAENKLRLFNRQQFAKEKPEGTYRVFCLGGSTTYGRPYDDTTSFCGWLRAFLPTADPSRDWEVINAGGVSYASYRVATLSEELIRYEPDLFVIYSGQNEFLERRTYHRIINTPPAVRGLGAIVSRTRTFTVAKKAIDAVGQQFRGSEEKPDLLAGEVMTMLDEVVGPEEYHRDDKFRKQVIDHYRYNLSRVIDIAHAAGAKVLLVAPCSNLLNCSPFKSEHRDGLSSAQLESWQKLFAQAGRDCVAKQWNEAVANLDKAAKIDDRYAHLHYIRGQVLYQLNRYDEAKVALQRACDEDVCPLRALSEMSRVVAEVAAQRDVPVVDFAALLESRSKAGIPDGNLFFDHVHPTIEGNRMLALSILERMTEEGLVSLADTWDDAAIGQVTRDVESRLDQRSHGIALRNLSKVLGWAGKQEEAAGLALQATRLAPDDAEAFFEAAIGFKAAGDVEQAITFYRRAVRLDPGYAQAHTNLGSLLDQRGDIDSAEYHYRQAIALNGQDHKAHFNLGSTLLKRGHFQKALEHFRRVTELRPEDTEASIQLASTLVQMAKFQDAITEMERAVELKPDNPDVHDKLGALRAAVGEYGKALQSYRKALALDADHAGAVENLAWLLATAPDKKLRRGAEAVRLAESACRNRDFKDPAVLDVLSVAQAENGQFDRATVTAKKALELAETKGQRGLAEAIRGRLELFLANRPYREGTTLK